MENLIPIKSSYLSLTFAVLEKTLIFQSFVIFLQVTETSMQENSLS